MQLSQFLKDAVKRFFFFFSYEPFPQLSLIYSHDHEENVSYSSSEQRIRFSESRSLTPSKDTPLLQKVVGVCHGNPFWALKLMLALLLS